MSSPPKNYEEITDKEIEAYIQLCDFRVTRATIAFFFTAMAIGFFFHGGIGLMWALGAAVSFKFALIPIFLRIMAPITKKHDPDGYRQYIDFKKREYYRKNYE